MYDKLVGIVREYLSLSSCLCNTLLDLKKALLLFDNTQLNRILDEKMVLNEQIFLVNQQLELFMIERYGEFNANASKNLLNDFPEIKPLWDNLRSVMKALKSHAFDVRRVINMIEKYHEEMNIALDRAKPKLYNPYVKRS